MSTSKHLKNCPFLDLKGVVAISYDKEWFIKMLRNIQKTPKSGNKLKELWNTFEKNVQTRWNRKFPMSLTTFQKIYKNIEIVRFSLKCSERSSDRETIIQKIILTNVFFVQESFGIKFFHRVVFPKPLHKDLDFR